MTTKFFTIALATILVATVAPTASAQNQQAPTKLAESVQPTSVDDVAKCIVTLAGVLSVDEAKNTCLTAQKVAVGESKKLANEVADATQKNRWPQPPAYGGSYGNGGVVTTARVDGYRRP